MNIFQLQTYIFLKQNLCQDMLNFIIKLYMYRNGWKPSDSYSSNFHSITANWVKSCVLFGINWICFSCKIVYCEWKINNPIHNCFLNNINFYHYWNIQWKNIEFYKSFIIIQWSNILTTDIHNTIQNITSYTKLKLSLMHGKHKTKEKVWN